MLRKLTYLGSVFGLLAMFIAGSWSIHVQAASPTVQTDLEEAGLDQTFQTMAVSGRVFPAEAGLFIQLIADESLIDETITDEAGYFYFQPQTDGVYSFRILDAAHSEERPLVEPVLTDPTSAADYYLLLAEPTSAAEPNATTADLQVQETASPMMDVRGQVLPADASLRIKLYQVGKTESLAETYTTPDGLFNFGEQPSGRYYFQVIGRDGNPVALQEPIILEETSLHPTAILELDYEAQSSEAEQEPSAAPQDTSTTNADSLSGRITAADTGLPLSNVRVHVYEKDFLQFSYDDTMTDADGYYRFSYLYPRDYHLLVEKSGVYPKTIYDGQSSFSTATPITINSGVPITIDMAIQPGGAIQGTLTDTQNGGPLVRAQPYHSPIYIRVLDPTTADVIASVEAEADSYVLGGLAPGNYVLQAYAPLPNDPFDPYQTYVSKYHNNVYSFADATPITISSGVTQTIDFSLEQGAIINGQITDPDTGLPLQINRVIAYNIDDPAISFKDEGITSAGEFIIQPVPAGTYTLYFEASLTNSNNSYNFVSSYYGGGQTIETATTFTVTHYVTTTVNHVMTPGGVIDGLLTVNKTGETLEENQISSVVAFEVTTGNLVKRDNTLESGRYKLTGLTEGEYILHFELYAPLLSEYYPGVQKFDTAAPVSVTLGMTTTVDYAVQMAGIISGTLTDTQTGQPLTNADIGRVQISQTSITNNSGGTNTINNDGTYQISGLLPGMYYVYFNADEYFDPQSFNYLDLDSPYYSLYYDSASTSNNAVQVNVTADAITIVDQAFTKGGAIEGTLTDINTGEILTSTAVAQVQAHNLDTGKIDATQEIGEDGRYQIIGLPTGNYALFFEARSGTNYESAFYDHVPAIAEATPISITNSMTTTLDYAFNTKGIIKGVLTDLHTGQPVDSTSIQQIILYAMDANAFPYPNTSISTQVNADGSYQFVGLKSGFYKIEYKTYSNSPYLTDFYGGVKNKADAALVEVTAGQVTTVNYGMRRGGTIAGVVTNAATGQPIASELFEAAYAEGTEQSLGTNTIDEDGRYNIPKLRPGTYQVRFITPADSGYVSDYYRDPLYGPIAEIAVLENMTTTVDYAFIEGSTLYGTLTDAETGDPLTSADIYYISVQDFILQRSLNGSYLNDQGEFAINNLPPGQYELHFSGNNGTSYDTKLGLPFTIGTGTAITINHQLYKGGVISGVVTAEDTGLPLNGVYVKVVGINDCGVQFSLNGYSDKYTYTQVDGTYQLDGLSNGDYIVEFASLSNQEFPYLIAEQRITISDYQPVVIDQTLRLGAIIEGYITAKDTTLPLEDVYVFAFTRSYNEQLDKYVYHTVNGDVTDQNGFYHINKLDDGEHFLGIRTRNNSPYVSEGYTNAPYFDKTSYTPLSVVQGETLEINESLAKGGQISGQITDSDTLNNITSSYWIKIFPHENFNEENYYFIDPSGSSYISTGLPDGDYIVKFEQSSFNSNEAGHIDEYYGGAFDLESASIVTIQNGQSVSNVNAATIKGGNIYGEALSKSGNSLEVPVYLYDTNGSLADSTYSDHNYGYRFFGIKPGTYYVLFGNESYFYYNKQCKGALQTFTYGIYYGQSATFNEAQPVEAKAGEITMGIDGVLSNTEAPQLPEQQLAVILGTVKDQDGQPIANTRINFNDSANRAKQASTDENGDYQIELQKGQYVLTANRTGYSFSPPQALIQLEEDVVQDFTGEALPLNSTITGMVTAEGTQTPLPNIEVDVYQLVDGYWDFVQTTSTDDSGGYAFSLTAASYRLYFADPSGVYTAAYYGNTSNLYQAQTIVLEAGQAATADVALTAQSPAITVDSGSYTVDPATGETIITVANGQTEQIQISYAPECPTGTPQNVKLVIGFKAFDMTANGDGTFSVSFTVPDDIDYSAPMIVQYECEGMGYAVVAGQLELYDPSGIITDITTGAVISNAVVTLYRIPHALPDTAAQTNQCRTAETQPATTGGPFGAWSGLPAADLSLGTPVNAAVDEYNGYPLFEPTIPSQQTNTAGYYGWDVAEGCWFVTVEAEGYQTAVSPVVGVPPAVLNLDIALTPEGGPPPPPPNPTIYLPMITD